MLQHYFLPEDRQEELQQIKSAVKRTHCVAVWSLYDVGKNPFFHQVEAELKQDSSLVVCSINGSRISTWPETIYHLVYSAITGKEIEQTRLPSECVSFIKEWATNHTLVLNIQLDYLTEVTRVEPVLEIIRELRNLEPSAIIPIIHVYWTAANAEVLNQSIYRSLLLGSSVHLKPYTEKDFPHALHYFSKKNKVELSPEQQKWLWRISGGIPMIYKQAYLWGEEQGRDLSSSASITEFVRSDRWRSYQHQLVSDLGYTLARALQHCAQGEVSAVAPEARQQLQEWRLINKNGQVQSEAIATGIAHVTLVDPVSPDTDSAHIKELFTESESKIMKLLQRPDVITTRQEIASAIWGSNYWDKYSDYAIDRHLSNIRKKLCLTKSGSIITYKNRGVQYKHR